MLFDVATRLVRQLLTESIEEGQDLMLLGSGVWFGVLNRALERALEDYASKIAVSKPGTLVRVSFKAGGSIQTADLATGENMEVLDINRSRVPSKAYLVEDSHGENIDIWAERVCPFLQEGKCDVVYIGDSEDVKSS